MYERPITSLKNDISSNVTTMSQTKFHRADRLGLRGQEHVILRNDMVHIYVAYTYIYIYIYISKSLEFGAFGGEKERREFRVLFRYRSGNGCSFSS